MNEYFVKKFWGDENVLFYIHFKEDTAIEQIEITPDGVKFLTLESPVQGDSMLFDQSLDALDLNEADFITSNEFFLLRDKLISNMSK